MFVSNTLNQSQSDSAGGQLTAFDDQFLKMALRISTYPVVMIIVNGLITGALLAIICCAVRILMERQASTCTSRTRAASIRIRPTRSTASTTSSMVVEAFFSPWSV